jgi:hypothetical protein
MSDRNGERHREDQQGVGEIKRDKEGPDKEEQGSSDMAPLKDSHQMVYQVSFHQVAT